MSISAFKRVLAVGAVIAAVAGVSGSRPAAALTFVFQATCNDPGLCDPSNSPDGVGLGTLITGTLQLSQTSALVGDLIMASDILSFDLTFTPGAPSFQSNPSFSYTFPFLPGIIVGSDPIGQFGGAGSLLTIKNIDFQDSTMPTANLFNYSSSETQGSGSFILFSFQPQATGGGIESPNDTFSFNQQATNVPEPGTLATFLLGISGLMMVGRRRQRRTNPAQAA